MLRRERLQAVVACVLVYTCCASTSLPPRRLVLVLVLGKLYGYIRPFGGLYYPSSTYPPLPWPTISTSSFSPTPVRYRPPLCPSSLPSLSPPLHNTRAHSEEGLFFPELSQAFPALSQVTFPGGFPRLSQALSQHFPGVMGKFSQEQWENSGKALGRYYNLHDTPLS